MDRSVSVAGSTGAEQQLRQANPAGSGCRLIFGRYLTFITTVINSEQLVARGEFLKKVNKMTEQQSWENVDKSAECWLWQRSIYTNGYGRVWFEKRFWQAHRLAWHLSNGP